MLLIFYCSHTYIIYIFFGFSLFLLFSVWFVFCVTKLKWVRSFFRRQKKCVLELIPSGKIKKKWIGRLFQTVTNEILRNVCTKKKDFFFTDISCKLQFICVTVIFHSAISLATFYQYPFRFLMRMATQHFFFFLRRIKQNAKYIECQRSMFRLL